jgi:glutamine---fructose-6-phosphate transaminase (isomerizing)
MRDWWASTCSRSSRAFRRRVEYASEFRYRNAVIEEDTLALAISQSGETADTLAALREARQHGATTMGIVNAVGSTIARETDFGIYLHAGPEIGVASTKAFTSQLVALALFTLFMGRRRHLSVLQGREIVAALQELPTRSRKSSSSNDEVRDLARLQGLEQLPLSRTGLPVPGCARGRAQAEGGQLHPRRGVSGRRDEARPHRAHRRRHAGGGARAPRRDPVYKKVVSNIEEVKARGGRIIAVVSDDAPELQDKVDHMIKVPQTIPCLLPVLTTVPLQLLAYHTAVLRGADVDQPRNLAKSVTVE